MGLGWLIDRGILKIAEPIIKRTGVKLDKVDIKNLKDDGFELYLEASLTDTGPTPATITFNDLKVIWSGSQIATLELFNSVSVLPIQGGLLKTNGRLTISDQASFTQFLGKVLTEKSFDWIVESSNLGVVSGIIPVNKIPFSKVITWKAFDGLRDISLQGFKLLPPDVKNDPSIKIRADVTVVSKSQLSILIGKVSFYFSLGESIIGEVSTDKLEFPADGKTCFQFLGQTVKPDLRAVGILISKFLNGEQQTLKIQAKSVHPTVPWFIPAVSSHALYVRLDGERRKVIEDIELSGVSIIEDRDQWRVSSTCTRITYINPFGFSFQIVEVDVAAVLGYEGIDEVAKLDFKGMTAIVEHESINEAPGMVRVEFKNEILNILALQKFHAWRDKVESSPNTPVKLHGTAKVVVNTPIGRVTIADLPFDFPCKFEDLKWL